MILEKTGNIFNSTAQLIGHGVNLQGVMGAGIAKTVRELYPEVYEVYREACEQELFTVGGILPVKTHDNRIIVNMASQDKPGANARYDWLEETVAATMSYMDKNNYSSLALPQIGSGIGGLEWRKVKNIIERNVPYFFEGVIELWTFDPTK